MAANKGAKPERFAVTVDSQFLRRRASMLIMVAENKRDMQVQVMRAPVAHGSDDCFLLAVTCVKKVAQHNQVFRFCRADDVAEAIQVAVGDKRGDGDSGSMEGTGLAKVGISQEEGCAARPIERAFGQ